VLRRGRGLAVALKAVISPTTSVAIVNIAGDGSTTLYCGTVDMGQGSDTAMAQIVGEVLNMPAETIRIVPRDTDVTPYDMGTLGSRSLFHMGHAVRLAAEEAKAKIAALARAEGTTRVVVGLPRNMDGSEGPQAEAARAFGAELTAIGLDVDFVDERLTTWQAGERLAAAGRRAERRTGEKDSAAACLILQEWLDRRRPHDAA
jgi:putative transcription antitermination factor YqgF